MGHAGSGASADRDVLEGNHVDGIDSKCARLACLLQLVRIRSEGEGELSCLVYICLPDAKAVALNALVDMARSAAAARARPGA